MLNKIIEFSIKNKLIIGLFTIALILYGIYQTTQLPIDAVPDITNNQVQVITVASALGATDIERLVTFPIEQVTSNIAGLHEVRSFSRFGLSLVTIVFDDNVDIYWARQQVTERLQQVQANLPAGVNSVSMGPITTGLGEIYQYCVRAKAGYENKYDVIQLRTIQDWIVRRQLLGVKGVADVSSFGGKLKQYEIAVNSNKLQSFGITINEIFNALENNNQNTGGAYIEKGPTVLYIRSEGLVGSINDINSIFIKNTSNGTPLMIRDVADVRIGNATRYGAMCYNDKGEVAGAVVMMLKGENSSEVIKNVKIRIAQIQKSLPEGVVIEPFLDRTKMVNNSIGTVETNLIEGALIVLLVLLLFLGNLRAGLLVASVIPLSMLFAVIMMNVFGVSGNLMSLGALDFGLIIDGAVIIVEAVLYSLYHQKNNIISKQISQAELDDTVKKSSSRMMNSAVFGQVIILVVYLPIFFLEGIEGKMFKPMVQTVVFSLLGAFILSLTYVPMMSTIMIGKKIKLQENISDKILSIIDKFYQQLLLKTLANKKSVLAFSILIFLTSLVVFSQMGGEFIPALEEGDFAVETRVLPGSNLNTTIESTQKAAHILTTQFPEVKQVVTKIGSGEIPTDPMPLEAADMIIILKDKKEWTSAKTFNELSEKMSAAIADVPGVTTSFQYPVQMRFNELMTGSKQDVVCKIFGENLDTLAKYAKKLGELAATINGTKNLYVEQITGMPEIIIDYNRAAIAQFGLSISAINKVVNTGLAGQSAGLIYEGEKSFDMVVRLNGEQRKNIDAIKNILIPTNNGSQVPLYQLATVEIKDGPNQIQREDAKRRIIVGFNIHDRDVQSIVEDLQQQVNTTIKLPPGYYISYGGAFQNLNAAKSRLMITVPIALLLIFLLLYFSFNSIQQGLMIYSAIPLSAMGGIFALAIRGMPFSISAGVGFIALFGVAVLNGIVLIAEFNRLKNEGLNDAKQIVLLGTKIRLRPVLMTAFVASLGFLPMALSNGAGAEVQRPLATVVIGGLMIATFLTLFVLPTLYILFEKSNKNVKPNHIIPIVAMLLLLAATTTNAQTTIDLKTATEKALKNNLNLKNEILKANFQKKLIAASCNIPTTNVFAEAGQINSFYNDTKWGISQSISFPSVYSNQKKLQNEEWKSANLNVALKESEIKKMVAQIFYSIILLKQKENILVAADSNYAAFLSKSKLRLATGESNILETVTAETQRNSIQMQLKLVQQNIELQLLEFQLLLNTDEIFQPISSEIKIEMHSKIDSQMILNHPIFQIATKQKQIAIQNIHLEKSKLLPELNFGYFNTSIKGIGANDIFYTASSRFSSAQIGLGVPLFFKAQNAKINAFKIQESIANNSIEAQLNNLKINLKMATIKYSNALDAVDYFEQKGLPNAKLIYATTQLQYANGEINYLEWVMLNNQAIEIESKYLDAVEALNESIITIQYLTSNY